MDLCGLLVLKKVFYFLTRRSKILLIGILMWISFLATSGSSTYHESLMIDLLLTSGWFPSRSRGRMGNQFFWGRGDVASCRLFVPLLWQQWDPASTLGVSIHQSFKHWLRIKRGDASGVFLPMFNCLHSGAHLIQFMLQKTSKACPSPSHPPFFRFLSKISRLNPTWAQL